MSSETTPDQTTPMVTCRVCGTDVPTGEFCGFCGSYLSKEPGIGPDWLRIRAYGAAEGENAIRLSVVSSLFPHLPSRSRAAFRTGFAGLIVLLIVLALFRWQAPLVAVSALGFPFLFVIYLEESDVYGDDDLPVTTMLLTAGLGIVLGVCFALWTGPLVARSFFTIGGLSAQGILLYGLAIPVAGALLMLVPAVVVRLMRPRQLESLDGFLIGSLGAIAFTAAGSLTRLAPQMVTGLRADHQFLGSLLIEAGLQGVAVPLTAAAAGGAFGAALWLTTEPGTQVRHKAALILQALAVVVVVYAMLGIIDVARLWPPLQLFLHLLIAALAILAVRIAIQLALLREAHKEMRGEPIVCPECHHVIPDMAFCPNCGVSTRASSRTLRDEARVDAEPPPDTTSLPDTTTENS